MDRELRRRVAFAEGFQKRLTELGLSAREAAKKCGFSNGTISRYLSGERLPDISALGRIIDAIGFDISSFMYMDNDDYSWDEIFEEFKDEYFTNRDACRYHIVNAYTVISERPRTIGVRSIDGRGVYLYNHAEKSTRFVSIKEYEKMLKR